MRRITIPALLLLIALGLTACGKMGYYLHSINGHLTIMGGRQSIEQLLSRPDTAPELKQKLQRAQAIRRYASEELGLPDNKSYKYYVDLKRPYVVWNVFATPEFSVVPVKWCFLITGCVSYRGYFDRAHAGKFAAKLRSKGHDIYVGGVTAYSTLGWFADPVLNTFLNRPEIELAALMFHELAHQLVYVKNDSAFNESFATVIELEGARRWVQTYGSPQDYQRLLQHRQRQREFVRLILKYRDQLRRLYTRKLPVPAKRSAKQKIFSALKQEYKKLKQNWGGYRGYDRWMAQDLNNAHLASIGTYHNYVPAFQVMLKNANGDLRVFYRRVRALAKLPLAERQQRLGALQSK